VQRTGRFQETGPLAASPVVESAPLSPQRIRSYCTSVSPRREGRQCGPQRPVRMMAQEALPSTIQSPRAAHLIWGLRCTTHQGVDDEPLTAPATARTGVWNHPPRAARGEWARIPRFAPVSRSDPISSPWSATSLAQPRSIGHRDKQVALTRNCWNRPPGPGGNGPLRTEGLILEPTTANAGFWL
jgi:hypothetical protein